MASSQTPFKRLLRCFLNDLCETVDGKAASVLNRYCHRDCSWNFFQPYPDTCGNDAAAAFWTELKHAFPDMEIRPALMLTGRCEGDDHISMLGFAMGNHAGTWLNIPPTRRLSMLRLSVNAVVQENKFSQVVVMFDAIDLMRQAGFYPLRAMPGSAEQWPFAPGDDGFDMQPRRPVEGERTLAIVQEMQRGLPDADAVTDRASAAAAHSPHWDGNMNWYGPAGIGSARGMEGFRDYHGALFLKAFPDRSGIPRNQGSTGIIAQYFCEIGEGRLAMTAGWPAMRGTHMGGQWLGLPPSGRAIEMRVADWYRLNASEKIVDNWVMMDIPHILDQMGLDLFGDLRFFAEPGLPRLD